MSGYQFIHFENYARSPREKITGKGGVQRANKKTWGVKDILDEACREVGACPHVDAPKPPKVVYGCSVDELREMHDQVENAAQTRSDGKTRKIIKTQNTLATCVMSYPVPVDVLKKDKEEQERYFQWRERSIDFLKNLWGDNFKCGVQHLDEKFPHIHCYGLAPDWKANDLHPGLAVKPSKGKKGRDAGKEAIDALRHVQDQYQEQVGRYCGQTRLGPGKRRLSREAWKAEQSQQKAIQATLEQADTIKAGYKEKATRDAVNEFKEASLWGKMATTATHTKKQDLETAKEEGRQELQPIIDSVTNEKDDLKKQVKKLSSDLKVSRDLIAEKSAPAIQEKVKEECYQSIIEQLVDNDLDNNINPLPKLKQFQQMPDMPQSLSDFIIEIIKIIMQAFPSKQSNDYTFGR